MRQERFTEQAQQAIQASQQLAMQYKHSQWDVEHILMALLIQQHGLLGEILKEMAVNIEAVRDQLDEALNKTPKVAFQSGQIYATPRIGQVMQKADEEAQRLKDDFISVEHLFVGILSDEQGDAAKILAGGGGARHKRHHPP